MKGLFALTLVALVAAAVADGDAALKGAFCFVAAKHAPSCRAVEGNTIGIPAAEVERTFVWSSADGKRLVFGIVPPKNDSVDLADKTLRDVTLVVHGDRRHGWPENLRITVKDATKREWIWNVPAKSVESLADLRFPAGKYTIVFSADHHVSEQRRIDLAKSMSLREVLLRPMPAIAGRVLTMKDQPIANAQIVRTDRNVIASTDEGGNFRGEVGEPLPDSVLMEKPGFGSRLVPLQLAAGDVDLGTVRLGAGIKLSLHIGRPEGNHDPLHVGLQRKTESQYDYTPISSKELGVDVDKLVFEDLSQGEFSVVIEGKGLLEKLATEVRLGDTDGEKDIKIEPYRLDGTARIGEDPINGDLSIVMSRLRMQLKLPIENGQFSATLWQHGKLVGAVQAKELGSYEVVTSPELGADPSAWDIQFPKRLISGRIYDADTQQPIDGAKMDLLRTATAGDSRWYGSIRVQNDGTFSILSTKTGTYELSVSAPDHADMKQTIEVGDGDGSVQRDFALTRGLLATLEVVWPSGVPVANAAVLEGVASDGYQAERQYTLDASGRLSLRLQQGESQTLYIVPREGSLAVAHLAAQEGSDSNPVRVIMPEAAGALHIQILAMDGKPADAAVGMRFNGETIPAPVLYEIGFRATNLSALDDRLLLQLPAGAYELWPVSKQPWTVSTRSRPPIGAAKSVSVSAGVTNVELVARR